MLEAGTNEGLQSSSRRPIILNGPVNDADRLRAPRRVTPVEIHGKKELDWGVVNKCNYVSVQLENEDAEENSSPSKGKAIHPLSCP
jgi:hypothetical protein